MILFKNVPKNEDNNLTNTVYKSKRSKGLEYMYQSVNEVTKEQIKVFKKMLKELVNEDFDAPINENCIPLFRYTDGGVIKPHKDIDKTDENITFQRLVAIVVLTQQGQDFEGGRFYINPKATHSPDGKEVYDDFPKDRIYPSLNKGDLFIFDNRYFIHGVEETQVKENQVGRLTCSFRTLN